MDSALSYHAALTKAMAMLGEQRNAIFLGQGVVYPSTSMSSTFKDVPMSKRLEMPVAEELQAGMATGLALEGYLPISVFPRWNFMLRGLSAIVNTLDRLPIYSAGGYKPKVLIRVAVPSTSPFNPQSQHDDDFTHAVGSMLRTVRIATLGNAEEVAHCYDLALKRDVSTILVEYTDLYKDARATER